MKRSTRHWSEAKSCIQGDEQRKKWNKGSGDCVNICCCDWFNKEADWPIVRQDKARQKGILGRRRVESEESRADAEKRDELAI